MNRIVIAGSDQRRERLVWVDAAKGFGIILVVLGHALGGMFDAGYTPHPDFFRPLFLVIYTFHMPLFFMLSGLFVAARIEKKAGSFITGLLRSMIWPYVLWSALQLSVIKLAGSVVTVPVEDYTWTLLSIPWRPVSQFWFFYALTILHVLAYLVLDRVGPIFLLIGAFGLSSLAEHHVFGALLTDTGNMAPYYAIGVCIGWLGGVRSRWVATGWRLPALAAAAVVAVAAVTAHTLSTLGSSFYSLKAAEIAQIAFAFPNFFAAVLASLTIGCAIVQLGERMSGVFVYLGRHSLSIYVLHVLFVAGTRILLVKVLRLDDAGVTIVVLTIVGLTAPLLVYEAARLLRADKILGLS